MQNQQTRQLTNGAMMAAVFTVLLVITVYVPVLNVVTLFFLSLPVAWYSAKFHWKASALFAVVCLLLTFIAGGLLALPLALVYVPIGLVIGLSIHYKKSKLFMLMGSGLVLLASAILQYLGMIFLFGVNILQEMVDETKRSATEIAELMGSLGASEEEYMEAVNLLMTSFETLLPSILVLTIFLTVWILLLIQLPVLKRLGIEVPKFPPFRDMKLPKSILWYYLIVLLASMLTDLEPGTMPYMAFLNLSVLLQSLLFLQGISFYHFYIQQEGWPKWVAVLVTVLALPLQSFTSIVGIIDLGFDIRGWVKRAHEFKGK